jgi:hypothetical protein
MRRAELLTFLDKVILNSNYSQLDSPRVGAGRGNLSFKVEAESNFIALPLYDFRI